VKKSKCEKATEKYVKNIYGNDSFYQEEITDEAVAFRKGAEALLRYAKRKKVNHDCQGTCKYFGVDMVRFSDLEEWVNGAKQGGKG
jgi:hypothetical protein